MLEGHKHSASCVATLTYDKEHHPEDGSLSKRDYVLFLKRLRKAVAPLKIRYFICGEYGTETWRPHYHIIIFGIPPFADLIRETWGLGHVYVDNLTYESAQYVCGYLCKKMTSSEDPRLQGRLPEFARMSLRPSGIGATAMEDVARLLTDQAGVTGLQALGDVPSVLRSGKRKMPLGRYLRRKLREEAGFAELGQPARVQEKQFEHLRELSFLDGTVAAMATLDRDPSLQRIANLESRLKIWAKKEKL